MKKHFKTTGIIIRKVNLNEADQIITVLTADHGKISCIVKGSRRIKSKFCGRLELFYHIQITGFRGRNLEYLDEVEILDACPIFDLGLKSHSILFYIAEITHKLIQEEQQIEGVYTLLLDTLEHLQYPDDIEIILHTYLIKLLTILGFMAPWNRCAHSNIKLDIKEPLYLNASDASVISGTYATSNDMQLTPTFVKWINFMQNYPFADISNVSTTKKERIQVWELLQTVLQNILTKPLKSEEFLEMAV